MDPATNHALSRVERRRARRSQRFLDVARERFVRLGYDATTVEDISNRAGYSKRTVYLYFATKHELFCAVLHPELVALRERVEQAIALVGNGDGRTRLIAVAKAYDAFAREQPDVFALTMHFESEDFHRGRDVQDLPQHVAACIRVNEATSRRLDDVIERGFTDGSIQSDCTAAQFNLMFWAGLVGVLQVCARRDAILETHYRISSERLMDAFIAQFLGPHP